MTQSVSALSWQEQSDPEQPLANYTLNFVLDTVWQFRLSTAMYHFQPIDPKGVTVDNSQGAGTIRLLSAAFTVDILPYSREDIDLSNSSQQITFTFIPGTNPIIAPYSVPIVYWIKKPPGAQQNQLAINQAVQSAIVANVLGNMQPIINAGFTESQLLAGAATVTTGAGIYSPLEGWMVNGGAAPSEWIMQQRFNPFPGAPWGLRVQASATNVSIAPVVIGTALLSDDSAQFQGQQITLGVDITANNLPGGGSFNLSLITGSGTDQNIFLPFTGATVVAVAATAIPATGGFFQRRLQLTTAGALPNNINQLGIQISYNPGAPVNSSTNVTISRPQIDSGSIMQLFRTVPQVMERDRCLAFFECLNLEGLPDYPFAMGQTTGAADDWYLLKYVRKRAAPVITYSGNFLQWLNAAQVATTAASMTVNAPLALGREAAFIRNSAPFGVQFPMMLTSAADGSGRIIINARM